MDSHPAAVSQAERKRVNYLSMEFLSGHLLHDFINNLDYIRYFTTHEEIKQEW